jgi:beta-glucosidase
MKICIFTKKNNVKLPLIIILIFVLFFQKANQAQTLLKYKNSNLSSKERTLDLLKRMTLEEKVGQLLCPLGWEMYLKQGENITCSEKFKQLVKEKNVGMLWAVYRADPWTKKTLENGLNPELAAKAGNAPQQYVIENTRLGIPVFLAEECPHGHMAIGTTVFPTGIGLASTWSPGLLEAIGAAISKEIRLQGGHIGYGPILDLARDPRWSRVEETYGEDPVLCAIMGTAFVKGAGGGDLTKKYSILSTLKHFTAYGIPEGGQNGNMSFIGMRELHDNFLPPFKAVIQAGALSVMTGYNAIDGIPCSANSYLLTEILRKDWDFKGFTISDLGSIEGLKENHRVAHTLEEAAVMAANAGLDVDLGGNAYVSLIDAAKNGRIAASVIDSAVCRVLRMKFEMGLFESPYVNPATAKQEVRSPAHISLALKAAQESIVLLKNNNHVLPLNKENIKIAVIGPNADNIYNMLGDYTAPQDRQNVKTVLDGIKAKVKESQIEYVKGCAIRDTLHTTIDQAIAAALRADVVVMVVGGSSARDFKTSYLETGAAVTSQDNISDMESGEGFDRASLDLMGMQTDLLKAVKATGKPVIVVYIEGRPLNMNWASKNADALLCAWYPGQEGGNAIADILFGDYNPAGRLPVSIPQHVGQLPVYYNKKNPIGHNYVEMPITPLYSFGYGLSYSKFQYSDLQVVKKTHDDFEVSFTVQNTGDYDGDEVAQLYLRDEYASTVQPIKQLKHFERTFIKKGEKKKIIFIINHNDLSIINQKMEQVIEPGIFKVMIGASSDDIRLNSTLQVE